jgi:putative salt-induced outer membrane protein
MKNTVTVVTLLCALIALPVLADEDEAEEPAWTSALGLSFVATSGNSDTQTLGLDLLVTRKPLPWGLELGANALRAEQDGELTAERYQAFIRGKRALSDRWELFAGVSGTQDEFAGYDLRAVVEGGAVYKALLGPTHELAFDGGLTWTHEELITDEEDEYMGGILGLAYAWHITDTAAFGQRLKWYPNFDESEDWRAESETSLQAAVSTRVALKLGYVVRYENEPVEGFDDTDTTTTVSLVFSF